MWDWSLFVCARKGHLTYEPDEPGLRDRLMAPTAGGTAWRCLRFLVIGAAAYGVWRFRYDQAGIQRAFNNALPAIRSLYRDLGFNVGHSKLLPFIQHLFTYTSRWLTYLAIGLAVYALIELAESVGLWLATRWGEY